MSEPKSMYQELGVDAKKEKVKETFSGIIQNDFKGAFVNIVKDPFSPNRYVTIHSDGDGSKFVQRLLHFFETGEESIFQGMVDDAVAMNTSDVAAAGFVFETWLINNVLNIGLEPYLKEIIMKQIAIRMKEIRQLYKSHGFRFNFMGGETADLPQQVKTAIFDVSIMAWAKDKHLIKGNIQDGDLIYGFASDGQANWEPEKNSGIMSNGLTLARSCLMSSGYNVKYPLLSIGNDFYKGELSVRDRLSELSSDSVSASILSPTRQWPIVIANLMSRLIKKDSLQQLHGIVINTGGGATKILNIGSHKNIEFFKTMPSPPAIFQLIKKVSGESWQNMYETFNCGVGIDVIGENKKEFKDALAETSLALNVKHFKLGHCRVKEEKSNEKNKLFMQTNYGKFSY
jgi:phosphoribosylformylglycinamidine cyclo-ligase